MSICFFLIAIAKTFTHTHTHKAANSLALPPNNASFHLQICWAFSVPRTQGLDESKRQSSQAVWGCCLLTLLYNDFSYKQEVYSNNDQRSGCISQRQSHLSWSGTTHLTVIVCVRLDRSGGAKPVPASITTLPQNTHTPYEQRHCDSCNRDLPDHFNFMGPYCLWSPVDGNDRAHPAFMQSCPQVM